MSREIDIKVFKGRNIEKTFVFDDSNGNNYDFTTTKDVKLLLYLTNTPIEISGSLDLINSKVTFIFLSATHTKDLGMFEYQIEDRKITGETILIGKGNFEVIEYVPFSRTIEAFITTELPANLTLEQNYKNQRLFYWRNLLQNGFNISDDNLNVETAWPLLANVLLSKLIVYDALELAMKGSFVQFLGGSYSSIEDVGNGGVKSIETGPTKVEYHDASTWAKNALSSSKGSLSLFDTLTQSICGLARALKIKVPMCKGVSIPISPIYYQNPDWAYPTLEDMDDQVTSQG